MFLLGGGGGNKSVVRNHHQKIDKYTWQRKISFSVCFLFWFCCNHNPVASFTFEVKEDVEVVFVNSSENSKSFQWEFGDGTFDVASNPTHKFSANGKYDVKLTATNGKGSHSSVVTLNLDNVAAANYVFWTKHSNYLPVEIYIDGALQGNIRKSFSSAPDCFAPGALTVSTTPGNHRFRARGRNGSEWTEIELEFVKGDCKYLSLN